MKYLLLLLVCVGLLHAEEKPADTLQLTFKTIGFDFGRDDIFIKQADEYVPLVISRAAISSKAYTYAGPIVMSFYRQVKTADKVAYESVAQVTFPAGDPKQSGRFLLLFSGGKAAALHVTAVADDTAAFPLQTIRVINAMSGPSGLTARVEINKTTRLVAPEQIQLFPIPEAKDNRVEVHVSVQHRDKWIEANNNVFSCDSGSRCTLFLVNNTAPNAPAYQPPSIGFLSLMDRPGEKESPSGEDPEP